MMADFMDAEQEQLYHAMQRAWDELYIETDEPAQLLAALGTMVQTVFTDLCDGEDIRDDVARFFGVLLRELHLDLDDILQRLKER